VKSIVIGETQAKLRGDTHSAEPYKEQTYTKKNNGWLKGAAGIADISRKIPVNDYQEASKSVEKLTLIRKDLIEGTNSKPTQISQASLETPNIRFKLHSFRCDLRNSLEQTNLKRDSGPASLLRTETP
jgi:hypothetical protein